jgi:hypothetical protein
MMPLKTDDCTETVLYQAGGVYVHGEMQKKNPLTY